MNWSREEFAEGLSLIGCLGIMIGAIVVPGQMLDGLVREEAKTGTIFSIGLLAGSAVAAKGVRRLLRDLSGTAFAVGLVYFVFAVSSMFDPPGWRLGRMLGCLVTAALTTLAGWYGLRRFRAVDGST